MMIFNDDYKDKETKVWRRLKIYPSHTFYRRMPGFGTRVFWSQSVNCLQLINGGTERGIFLYADTLIKISVQ